VSPGETANPRRPRGRILIGCVLVSAVVCGALAALAIFVFVSRGRELEDEERSAASRAARDPRLARPLDSTAGEILFVLQHRKSLGTEDLYWVRVDGSAPVRLTRLPSRSSIGRPPVWSPDGNRIALSIESGVHVLEIGGAEMPGPVAEDSRSPAWSPDGRRLAFLGASESERPRLRIVDESGSVAEPSVRWPSLGWGRAHDLAWSPSGDLLAFTWTRIFSGRPRNTDLYVVEPDGTHLVNLTGLARDVQGSLAGVRWSPEGDRLAFSQGASGFWSLVTVRPDGADRVEFGGRLSGARAPYEVRGAQVPVWSPDGRRVAWSNRRGIVTTAPDGSDPAELTWGRTGGSEPAWSPDGTRLAFVGDSSAGQLWVMNADGSGLTRLTDLGEWVFAPAWRPGQ